MALGYYCNQALLMPETNSSGTASMAFLRKHEYPNIYHMKILDQVFLNETERLGWRTTVSSRRMILELLRSAVKENSLILLDPETLDELKTFIKNTQAGKMEASPGNHDDRVMALAIAVFGAQEVRELTASVDRDGDYMDYIRGRSNGSHPVELGRGGY